VPSAKYGEQPVLIPIEYSSNSVFNGSAFTGTQPTYTVEVEWCDSSAVTDALRNQYSAMKQFTLNSDRSLKTQLQLERAVTQYIDAINSTCEAAVRAIRIRGPFDIPSDFVVIEMPALDNSDQHRMSSATRRAAGVNKAIVYTTTHRPTTAQIRSLMATDTGAYTMESLMPIVAAYYSDIQADTATAIDTDDMFSVRAAISSAAESELVISSERQRCAVSSIIENTVLFDRAAVAADSSVRNSLYEQVRYATVSTKLQQWHSALNSFSVSAVGYSKKQRVNNGIGKVASSDLDKCAQKFIRSSDGLSKSAIAEAAEQQCELVIADILNSVRTLDLNASDPANIQQYVDQVKCSELIAEATRWPEIACQMSMSDFVRSAVASFANLYADAAQSSTQHCEVKPGSAVLQYLTDCATSTLEVKFITQVPCTSVVCT
jgi:hypothetical protein